MTIMLTCKEASQLGSKALDVKLTLRERIGLSLHIAMCNLCRRYINDIKKMRNLMIGAGESGQNFLSDSVKLSPQSRKRIEERLRKTLDKSE